jgi:hypothetical protein
MPKVPKSKWTEEEKEFDRLVEMSESRDQIQRIEGRTGLWAMEKRLGKEEMDRMWERIK